jgi:hypothetical protein
MPAEIIFRSDSPAFGGKLASNNLRRFFVFCHSRILRSGIHFIYKHKSTSQRKLLPAQTVSLDIHEEKTFTRHTLWRAHFRWLAVARMSRLRKRASNLRNSGISSIFLNDLYINIYCIINKNKVI